MNHYAFASQHFYERRLSSSLTKGLLISLALVLAIYIYGWRVTKPAEPAAE